MPRPQIEKTHAHSYGILPPIPWILVHIMYYSGEWHPNLYTTHINSDKILGCIQMNTNSGVILSLYWYTAHNSECWLPGFFFFSEIQNNNNTSKAFRNWFIYEKLIQKITYLHKTSHSAEGKFSFSMQYCSASIFQHFKFMQSNRKNFKRFYIKSNGDNISLKMKKHSILDGMRWYLLYSVYIHE